MKSRATRHALLIGACLVLSFPWIAERAQAQPVTTSDLLLPYFEVEVAPGDSAASTVFAVGNDSAEEQIATATLFTNWANPVLELEMVLAPWQVRTVNLRHWIVEGRLPEGRQLDPEALEHLQAALTGRASPRTGLYYGSAVPRFDASNQPFSESSLAVGYATIRLEDRSRPDVLWGDFFLVDVEHNALEGELLIDIDPAHAVRGCQEGGSLYPRHLVRFMAERSMPCDSRLVVWTGKGHAPSSEPAVPTSAQTELSLSCYTEPGVLFDESTVDVLAVEALPLADMMTEPFGWLDLTTRRHRSEVDSFVFVLHGAMDRLGVAVRDWCPAKRITPDLRSVPDIDLDKFTNGQATPWPPGVEVAVGDPVEWTYRVTNTGETDLAEIEVVDDDLGVVVECTESELAPGDSMLCVARGVAEPCQYSNVAVVTAVAPDGSGVDDDDVGHYFGLVTPSVSIEGRVNGSDADLPPGPTFLIGESLQWELTVSNGGDVALELSVSLDGASPTCPRTDLGPGEAMICVATTVAQASAAPTLVNARAVGVPPCGDPVEDVDPTYYGTRTLVSTVDLEKMTQGEDADQAPGPSLAVGAEVLWQFVVVNTGETPLEEIQVVDDSVTVQCPGSALEVGESMTCTSLGVATACQHANLARVTAFGPGRVEVSDSDPSHYFGVPSPAIQVEGLVNGSDADTPPGPQYLYGTPLEWTFPVVNTGDVTLDPVVVTTDGPIPECPASSLAPGEEMICRAETVATVERPEDSRCIKTPWEVIVVARGTPPCGEGVESSDSTHYVVKR